MRHAFTRSILALTLTLAGGLSATASAQDLVANGQRVEPKPIAATDPLAVRSASLVKHILAGEKDAAVALLRKEADETYAKSDKLVADVEAQIKRLSTAKYTISDYQTGLGNDVMVLLRTDKGEQGNIVIRFNDTKKMTGFAYARIDVG